jgi:sulfoxide reductase heme-binding subunit YedZ
MWLSVGAWLGGGDPSHAFWYLSRAAGLCAFALLTFDVTLGLSVRTRLLEPHLARWRAFDLHQFTGLLALSVAGLHVLALLGDHYIGFRLSQLLVPFTAPYRPVWTALGTLGLYLLGGLVASFYARRLIGYRAWRTIHYATFGAFALALLHGLFAGTDAGTPWARALYLGAGALVTTLALWRFRGAPARPAPRGAGAPAPRRWPGPAL